MWASSRASSGFAVFDLNMGESCYGISQTSQSTCRDERVTKLKFSGACGCESRTKIGVVGLTGRAGEL